ncbi:MAG: hypothetical protein KKH51_06425 [Actinobacteria bacterium]|nr:hypothetical protein [Actinomycetota bacterium]
MSTFRNPVGPQSSRVYWRRRLVVLLGLLAVIIVIVLIVVKPGSGSTGSSTPKPGQTSSSAPKPGSTNSADAVACDPAKVTVEGGTDATSYDAGVNPVLTFTLKSLMTEPCTLAVGSDSQEFKVTSGDELIWSSKDCQTDAVAATTVLMPGVPKAGPTVTWDRTRSSADTCDSARDPVIAGGASYHLTVVVGTLTSTNDRQFLLY